MSNYKNIKHVCFDLDGTLMDSHKTIYKTTVKTLDELNIKHNLREEELYKRIGHHFLNIFADLDITVEDFEHFINIYKGYYFNFIDYSVIYPDALELIKILNDNPNWKVELGSHTDARGSDKYNIRLSQRRSDSAVGYIVKSGIAKERIIAKGYGETQLVNHCKNGVKCSDEVHRQNRRTEFKILEMDNK